MRPVITDDSGNRKGAQLFNYLRVSRMQVGYLLNFGAASKLEWKRFIISNQ